MTSFAQKAKSGARVTTAYELTKNLDEVRPYRYKDYTWTANPPCHASTSGTSFRFGDHPHGGIILAAGNRDGPTPATTNAWETRWGHIQIGYRYGGRLRGGKLAPHQNIASGCWAANNTPAPYRVQGDVISAPSLTFARVTRRRGSFCRCCCCGSGRGRELVNLGHVALDRTKVRPNALKHKAMSYKRTKEKEAQLQGEVDEEEDRRYGKDKRGDELPA